VTITRGHDRAKDGRARGPGLQRFVLPGHFAGRRLHRQRTSNLLATQMNRGAAGNRLQL
jgi:hypothetical protein